MQDEARDAGGFRRQLQAPARRERQCLDFADHRGERAAAQPLFHCPEKLALVGRADEQQPLCRKPGQSQAGRMEIGLLEAPQHWPLRHEPRQDAGEKRRRRATPAATRHADAFDLVQRRQRQATPWQGAVDRRRAERQDGIRRLAKTFRRGKIAAQLNQPRMAGIFRRSLTHNVLYLFFSFG
jgi:hypothetical protein